ncbi:hypothetical protein [Arthrobacter sp. MYb227]|uniref:hypothetical protein n=1 Tax=Arthrobacter sp. MYb227 TaxID=1848601 RepID=UPI0011B08ADA|nr:hypothetical protein [Arthrobacter sp. MYb227]
MAVGTKAPCGPESLISVPLSWWEPRPLQQGVFLGSVRSTPELAILVLALIVTATETISSSVAKTGGHR